MNIFTVFLILSFFIYRPLIAVEITGATFSHDPATLIKEGDTYWHFYTAPGIGISTSKNLSKWTHSNSHIFTPGSNWKSNYPSWTLPYFGKKNEDGNIWAPDIIYMNSAYYLYYSCSSFGSSYSAIGLVKTTSLRNSQWKDMGKIISSNSRSDINAIDPGLFRDDDRKVYMVYGSWSGGIGIVDIDTITGLVISAATELYGGNGLDTEAPSIFKKDRYYYLVVNRGTCCAGINSTYKIIIGRSKHVKGPYKEFRTLMKNKEGKYIGPGHFSLLKDDCNDYISIHYYDKNKEGIATLDILKMKMKNEWPVLNRDFSFDDCDKKVFLKHGINRFIKKETSLHFHLVNTDQFIKYKNPSFLLKQHNSVKVMIFTSSGKIIFNKDFKMNIIIPVKIKFTKGIYFLMADCRGEKYCMRILIK